MGQIANQMFAEWCCKIARKIGDKRKSQKAKKQKSEEAGKKSEDNSALTEDAK